MAYAAVNGLEMYYEVHGDGPPFAAAALWDGFDFRHVDPVSSRHSSR